jgi:plastocyanin
MKKRFGTARTIFALFLFSMTAATASGAATHVVAFGGSVGLAYSPDHFNCLVGDTVKWEGSFSSHPLSSTTVPGGATAWHNATGSTYFYAVKVAGTYHYKCDIHSGSGMVGQFTAAASAVEDRTQAVRPAIFELEQNYPNPFNSSTNLHFTVFESGTAVLSLYDATGRMVFSPLRRSVRPGDYVFPLDLSSFPSGTYFIGFSLDQRSAVRKMILIK